MYDDVPSILLLFLILNDLFFTLSMKYREIRVTENFDIVHFISDFPLN